MAEAAFDFNAPTQELMPCIPAEDAEWSIHVIEIPYAPREWQLDVHHAMRRFSVVVLHRRAGKTVMAINSLISAALRATTPDALYAYIAPFKKQAKKVAWRYLLYFTRNIPDCVVRESELSVQLPNGATIYLEGADNADALRGGYLDGCVLDEVGDMRPHVWGEIIRPMLADRIGWCLFIGTVKGLNLLSDLYMRAVKGEDPEWFATLKTCYETDALQPTEIEAARREMSEAQFRQEMLCDFNAASDNQLISLGEVEEAQARSYREDDYQLAPKIIGVDVARYGGDRSVVTRRQGLVAFEPQVWKGIDNMSLASNVARLISDWKPDAVFVDAGRGEGVIDRLLQLGFSPIGVDFGGTKGVSAEYINMRSQMWGEMAKWIKNGGALPRSTDLMLDLCTPTVDFKHASGAMRLESKDAMRERGAKSPDVGDSLALTFAYPVAPTRFVHAADAYQYSGSVGRSLTEYDPFEAGRY